MLVWFNKAAIEQTERPGRSDEKIVAIDYIIDTLMDAILQAALVGDKQEYRLDDGQTKIQVVYKDVAALSASHMALIRMKQYYINAKNGRTTRLLDSKNFPNWRICANGI